ncbi:MAG: ABC transporter substrate-binding protein [Pseudomonadota bacterium]
MKRLREQFGSRLGRALVAWVLLAVATTVSARPDPEAARAFMSQLADQAASVLQGDGALEDRERRLRTLLRDGFAIPIIARVSLGKHWRKVSSSERDDFTREFGEFLLRTYASRLGSFDRNNFKVGKATARGKRDVVVQTSIVQPSGAAVSAGWRIREVGGKLAIIDIIVEGVSMALNQRQEFSQVINRGGIGALMERLRARTERLPAESPVTS